LHTNFFKIAQILFDNKCDPTKMNNKAQSPLMLALESGNFILVDYLINNAKVEINLDTSRDGKNLLHYFAIKCDEYDLIQTLIKLPINDEIKKMGQMFDNNGRTPFHYCASSFNEFCKKYKASQGSKQSKKQYESIVEMIKYCLESIQCDPDVEVKTPVQQTKEENEDIQSIKDEGTISKPKETSIFSLLRTVSFADSTTQHPLEIFLTKTKNLNVLHHETQRTPLLEAIILQEYKIVHLLINESSCDVNLPTSNLPPERQQTPLIFACKLQSLPIIEELLNHKQCHILAYDYQHNQAIHYYLSTSIRSNKYLAILNLFIEKIKLINNLNIQGKDERTPLHIAVYHNSGAIDSTIDVEEILIDNGSDLFVKDRLGNIPLHNVFINKKVGDDPVELCALITKAMKYKSLDTENNEGNTSLHLAVVSSLKE
jgi:ankyrin repeat protein